MAKAGFLFPQICIFFNPFLPLSLIKNPLETDTTLSACHLTTPTLVLYYDLIIVNLAMCILHYCLLLTIFVK